MGNNDNPDMRYIFILNPTAGKHKAIDLMGKISEKFKSLQMSDKCEFKLTERPEHAKELAREYALKYGANAIIFACGGDGTVNEVLNGMIGTESIFSVIPAGTGNDFIKSSYTILDAEKIIEHILDYKIMRIDTAKIGQKYFVNVASLGFDTIVGDKAKDIVEKFRFLGRSAYFLAIFACIFSKNYSKVIYKLNCIDSDGKEYEVSENKEFVLVAIANGGYYGGMFNPCPDSNLSDGLLDVCLVDRLNAFKIIYLLPKYIKGTHTNHSSVHMHKVIKGNIKGDNEKLLVNIDGESFKSDSIQFEINPNSLKLAYY